LSSSWDHTCALLAGGEVKCWGWNESGQLGLGDTAVRGSGPGEMGSNLAPVDLGPGRTAVQISAGTNHTCALLDNGSVKCWGANNYGQLGLGDTAARGNDPGEMGAALDPVDLGAGVTATAISAGNDFTCAVLDSGDVKCWGKNDVGQLGQGDTVPRGDGPGEMGDNLDSVKLGPGRSAVSVAAGGTHACVVLDNDKVKCWGGNAAGRLGLGDTEARGDEPGEMGNQLPTVALGSGYQADAVTTGDAHTCVRLVGGALRCWGEGDFGRLGAGDTQDRGNGVTPIATVVEYEPPANDNRSAASSLTEASGLLGPVSTIGATEEPGEPDHGGEPGGSSVWYRFTAAGNGRAFFDTSASDYDTASAAYAFDGGAYTPVASAVFPTETMTFDMVAGKDYRIAIDGMDGDSGLLRFDYDLALPRPDVILRRGTGAPTGGNVYTPGVNIAQQSLRAFVRRNGTVVFSITLQNDAVFSDRLRVTGQGSTTRYAVTYRSASGANITSSVTRGSYQTPMLPSGGSQVIRLEVRALGTTPRDAVVARIVTARSTLQTTRSDSVKAIVRRE